ncbi:glycoside hydrolase family 95 protein [Kaistia dalseonensis]|uniref:Alpha-L-fucosidase 2 n=1 Tax=Kaistia dalseonensis TaxID=410840 RepID=A0ABU0H4U5_9HYPH|nr:glycoside hydrolase family 95 protein [Kaistia dalseonensis]MCX5494753.1 glycoside hydrolase family 95 protein [Kaistia dalseonensis]MDQ0437334.1 alpha-L-fucosidase 2 [Kaistia dalseonensis]
MSDSLWYPKESWVEWTAALPVGNGRLGAMVYGNSRKERIQLNEDTLWTGSPYSAANKGAHANLGALRQLLFAGEYAAAERLADASMMARPRVQMTYQSAGWIFIETRHRPEPGSYRRELDLASAVASIDYRHHGIHYRREIIASAPDNVIGIRMWTEGGERFDSDISYDIEQPFAPELDAVLGEIVCRGRNRAEYGVPAGLDWVARLRVVPDGGAMSVYDSGLRLAGVRGFTIWVDVGTSFVRYDDVSGDPEAATTRRLDAAVARGWDAIRADHIADYQSLYGRFALSFGAGKDDLPTDRRVADPVKETDPSLAALYVNYGRYLMISASRPGTQPANLQGIWNAEFRPAWNSKYTVNINAEMNYWLPDPTNLAACFEPLISLVEDVAETGREVAREHYGTGGWVLHHNTDLWRATGPIDQADPGLWPMGGVWLCCQLWDHCVYAGWPDDLLRRIYPLMRGAAEFLLDFLVELPGSDWLVTVPTNSPENVHPFGASLSVGCAMDNQLGRDLFDAILAAGVEEDESFLARVRETRSRLMPDQIGKAGQLQEWLEDWDMEAREMDHRHVSHLYALFPGLAIDPIETPELAAAARRSLEIRGDEATGWGIGWRICLWARLGDGERAWTVLKRQLSPDRTYTNLFDAHPPFQIDGNFGGAAGICEMIAQSRIGEIRLLPALPKALSNGSVRGLRLRGGIELDMAWSAGRVTSCQVRAVHGGQLTARFGGEVKVLEVVAGAWSRIV